MAINYGGSSVGTIAYNDTDVKEIFLDNNVVWCKPYTASVNSANGSFYRISSSEPTATTGEEFTSGKIYYGDTIRCGWFAGTETTTSKSPSSVSSPVYVSQFTGSYGFKVTNTNSFSVTHYYYLNGDMGRKPSSGWYSETISSGSTVNHYGIVSSSYNSVTVYGYFQTSATVYTTTTTYGPDNETAVQGLSVNSSGKILIHSGLYGWTASCVKDSDGLTRLRTTYNSNSSTSYTSISSSQVNKTLSR